jgi:hypothetical protein
MPLGGSTPVKSTANELPTHCNSANLDSLRHSLEVSNTTSNAKHRDGTSHFSLPLSCPRSLIPRRPLYPQAAARRLTACPHPAVFQPGGRHIRCGALSRRTTPRTLPTPERAGGSPRLRFRTLVRTASASRHQHPLPAGYRQAAHRVFSLLTSHTSPTRLPRFAPAATLAARTRTVTRDSHPRTPDRVGAESEGRNHLS